MTSRGRPFRTRQDPEANAFLVEWGDQVNSRIAAQDDFGPSCSLGRDMKTGFSGARSGLSQRVEEGWFKTTSARLTNVALQALADDDWHVIGVHYAVRGPAKMKAHEYGISVRAYYNRLNTAVSRFAKSRERVRARERAPRVKHATESIA